MGDVLGDRDVVESGERSRGWLLVVLVAVALAVGAGAVLRDGPDERAAPAPSPSASPSPSPGATVRTTAVTAAPTLLHALDHTGPYDALLAATGDGMVRVAPGRPPRPIDPTVAGPAVDAVRVRGGTVLVNAPGIGQGGVATFLPKGASAEGTDLGFVDRAAPALDDRTVWLQVGRVARRVSLPAGREVARRSLPPDTRVMAEVPGGLLLDAAGVPAAAVVDGDTVVRRLDGRVASATPRHAVLVDEHCTPPCVSVVDTATWTPRLFHGYDAERPPLLSPDGSTLAGYALALDGTARLVAYDVTSRAVITVDATAVSALTRVWPAWSPDSATLYLALTDETGASQLALWRRGADAVRLLPAVEGLSGVWAE
jgi:hypothetical protein